MWIVFVPDFRSAVSLIHCSVQEQVWPCFDVLNERVCYLACVVLNEHYCFLANVVLNECCTFLACVVLNERWCFLACVVGLVYLHSFLSAKGASILIIKFIKYCAPLNCLYLHTLDIIDKPLTAIHQFLTRQNPSYSPYGALQYLALAFFNFWLHFKSHVSLTNNPKSQRF